MAQTIIDVLDRPADRAGSFQAHHDREAVASRVGSSYDPIDAFGDVLVIAPAIVGFKIFAFDTEIIATAADLLAKQDPNVEPPKRNNPPIFI
ncbi:hypothetical protein NKH89_12270 [Mesorhizobium sp. M0923]|uniref:hypothetical protein n=1 Tax=Mesorhizobium sp. M0923 TaxID=2957028 RepID=UPI0033396BD9